MTEPGTFDRRVSFCTPVTTKSPMGSPAKVYTHSFWVWMSREPAASNQEQFVASRMVVPARYLYKGHYSADFNETLQIVDGTEKFNILSVNPTDRNMFIEIVAEKLTE